MAMEIVFVEDVIKKMDLLPITEVTGLHRRILDDSVTRPTLMLTGKLNHFKPNRIQVYGSEEQQLLQAMIDNDDFSVINEMLEHPQIPFIVFSYGRTPDKKFIKMCNEYEIPIYRSKLDSTMLIAKISRILREYFAPQVSVHGVMLEVCGIGVLIQGRSSIGKSETALELINRGKSKLVADDRVILYENEPGELIARAPKVLERMIEIRGIGVVDVISMFGGGGFKPSVKLELVIELQDWDKDFKYNRLGVDVEYIMFLNTQVSRLVLPVNAGRNVSNLIESASLNHQLKTLGINAAEEFTQRLTNAISDNSQNDGLDK